MEKPKSTFMNAWPYQEDKMNLPVPDLDRAIPFYINTMGFRQESTKDVPHKSAILSRDNIRIGLAENGGDPSQDGCFFEVDNIETAFAELQSNGLQKENAGYDMHTHGDTKWKVFFVVAPDGLCYCLGEKQE